MGNKKSLAFFFLLIIFVILGVVIWGSKNKKANTLSKVNVTQSEAPIFFYGNTCSHCADVEKWMRENKVEEKIKIIKKEVYGNRKNAEELRQAAKNCGLPTEKIGVPFLYTPEGKCLIGTPDVINYLSDKAGLSDNKRATTSAR